MGMAVSHDRAEVENTSCGAGSSCSASRDTSGGFFLNQQALGVTWDKLGVSPSQTGKARKSRKGS